MGVVLVEEAVVDDKLGVGPRTVEDVDLQDHSVTMRVMVVMVAQCQTRQRLQTHKAPRDLLVLLVVLQGHTLTAVVLQVVASCDLQRRQTDSLTHDQTFPATGCLGLTLDLGGQAADSPVRSCGCTCPTGG